jgi:hypothetical protein
MPTSMPPSARTSRAAWPLDGRARPSVAGFVFERDRESHPEVHDAAVRDRDVLAHDLRDSQIRTVLAAVSTALRAAASHDSELTPITSVTRKTASTIRSSSGRVVGAGVLSPAARQPRSGRSPDARRIGAVHRTYRARRSTCAGFRCISSAQLGRRRRGGRESMKRVAIGLLTLSGCDATSVTVERRSHRQNVHATVRGCISATEVRRPIPKNPARPG